ncbi:MAG: hypothetical protein ACR2G0_05075 [Chthoniobacterales bacterium]
MDRCIQPRLVRLSKLEAARRQIESAIWIWFVGEDYVSVYALSASAHRLLHETAAVRECATWPYAGSYITEPKAKTPRLDSEDGVSYFNSAKQLETYEISEQWTETNLFDAVMAYSSQVDSQSPSALMATFVVRFGVQRQDLFVPNAFSLLERKVSKTFNLKRLQALSKIEFLKEFLGVLDCPPE